MSKIKSIKRKNKQTNKYDKYYCAKDICEQAGMAWHSRKLAAVDEKEVDYQSVTYEMKNGYTQKKEVAVLSEKGVNQFCEKYGVTNPLTPTTKLISSDSAVSESRIKKLEALVDGLKKMVATLAVKDNEETVNKTIELTEVVSDSKVEVSDIIQQAQARRQVRQLCEDYAKAWALREGAKTTADKNLYFDYTWNNLYKKFNQQYSIDLKNLAKERSTDGTKVRALSVAETDGHAVNLLTLAKQLFSNK